MDALVILILIGAIGISFNIANHLLAKQAALPPANNARLLTNGIIERLVRNFPNLQQSLIQKQIQSDLAKIHSQLQVADTKGRLIYDSTRPGVALNDEEVDIKTYVHYDLFFQATNPEMARFTFPVVVSKQQVANAVFVMPKSSIFPDSSVKSAFTILSPLFVGVFILLIIFAYFLWRWNKELFRPLRQLDLAAQEITRGDMNQTIQCSANSELGRFCMTFDKMRLDLQDSLAKQADYERAHKELIATISHDLKTPAASIEAYASGLLDGIAKDQATIDKYLKVIREKTSSLVKLADDLLEHSLLELRQLKLNMEEQYSRKMLEEILNPIRIQYEKNAVSLEVKEPLPDVLVKVDRFRIEQVITNLIQNARKYTPDGGKILVSGTVEEDYLVISIYDTGYGITVADLPFIFDRFYRGQNYQAPDPGGSGLGLSICKYIIEEHGGQIFVQSALNQGSVFRFTIPKI
jgi:signal transduction histidine kinase